MTTVPATDTESTGKASEVGTGGTIAVVPAADAAGDATRRRLHPFTPLLRGVKLVTVAVAAVSWQGYRDLGTRGWLIALAGVIVAALAGSVVMWLVTGYQVVGRELRVHEGLVWRRTRAIPLERLQSVELVRPLLARLCGLAELRLEVVGSDKTEAPLAFLTVAEATRLRASLLALGRRGSRAAGTHAAATLPMGTLPTEPHAAGSGMSAAGVPTADGAPVDGSVAHRRTPAEHVMHVTPGRDIVISQLLRPQWWVLPLAVASQIVLAVAENDLSGVGVASAITATVGALSVPVRVLLRSWNFTIALGDDGGLRLTRGLVETRSQLVPAGRVQAVRVEWPLLWRGFGWLRVRMQVAGMPDSEEDPGAGWLLPVATVDVTQRVIAAAVTGFTLTDVKLCRVSRRARWLAPLGHRRLGYQLTDTAFVSHSGLVTRRLVVAGYQRIQSVRVRQNPVQRLFGVASVHADVAGGQLTVVAAHLDLAVAGELALLLTDACRAHRASNH